MTVEQLHEKYGLDRNSSAEEIVKRYKETGNLMHPTFIKHREPTSVIQTIWIHVLKGNMTISKAEELTASVIDEYVNKLQP